MKNKNLSCSTLNCPPFMCYEHENETKAEYSYIAKDYSCEEGIGGKYCGEFEPAMKKFVSIQKREGRINGLRHSCRLNSGSVNRLTESLIDQPMDLWFSAPALKNYATCSVLVIL